MHLSEEIENLIFEHTNNLTTVIYFDEKQAEILEKNRRMLIYFGILAVF